MRETEALDRPRARRVWLVLRFLFTTRTGLAATLLVLLAGSFLGSREAYAYWSSPTFCINCHHMEEYYASWERSSHNGVACVQCHFEPGIENELWGKWVALKQLATAVTGAYDARPHARVSDASCMRSGCHTSAQLEDPVLFTRHEIPFRHGNHLAEIRGGLKLTCSSCHSQVVISTHIEVDERSCFLCHFQEAGRRAGAAAGGCEVCHAPPADAREVGRFSLVHADLLERGMTCRDCHAEVHAGRGGVDRGRCLSCHNRPAQVASFDDVALVHAEHTEDAEFHCYQCHDLVEHEFEAAAPEERLEDCATCHAPAHGPQTDLLAGEGALGVPGRPSDMHAVSLDCLACHAQGSERLGEEGASAGGALAACSGCHAQGYAEVARSMSTTLGAMQEDLRRRLGSLDEVIEERVARGEHVGRDTYRGVTRTGSNLEFLDRGGAAHNPEYAIAVLREGDRELRAAAEALGVSAADPRPPGFEGETCVVCHVEALAVERRDRHPPAAAGLCTECHAPHTFGRPVRVRDEGWDACRRCHVAIAEDLDAGGTAHPPVGRGCGLCHAPHGSDHPALLAVEPKEMCVECHDTGLGLEGVAYHGALTTREGCGNCHETHVASLPWMLKAAPGELCLGCHERAQEHADGTAVTAVGERMRAAPHVHEPARAGACTVCHDPHGARGAHLLHDPDADRPYLPAGASEDRLCYDCHDPTAFTGERAQEGTGFRNGERNLHALHIAGDDVRARNCVLCHEPHASTLPFLLTDSVPCGTESFPLRFERLPRGGRCAPLCHGSMTYDREEAFPNAPIDRTAPEFRVPWPERD